MGLRGLACEGGDKARPRAGWAAGRKRGGGREGGLAVGRARVEAFRRQRGKGQGGCKVLQTLASSAKIVVPAVWAREVLQAECERVR